jgi:hypothetical protein
MGRCSAESGIEACWRYVPFVRRAAAPNFSRRPVRLLPACGLPLMTAANAVKLWCNPLILVVWRSLGELNPCFSLERAAS